MTKNKVLDDAPTEMENSIKKFHSGIGSDEKAGSVAKHALRDDKTLNKAFPLNEDTSHLVIPHQTKK